MFFLKKKSTNIATSSPESERETASTSTITSVEDFMAHLKLTQGIELTEELQGCLKKIITHRSDDRAYPHRLSPKELVKLKESLQLCETRRENIKQTINHIRYQLNWYKEFVELTRNVNDSKNILYQVQKEQVSIVTEANLLYRYEALTPLIGHYHSIIVQREELQKSRNNLNEIGKEIEKLRSTANQLRKQSDINIHDKERVRNKLDIMLPQVQQAIQLTGRMEELHKALAEKEQELHLIDITLATARKELEERTNEQKELTHKEEDNMLHPYSPTSHDLMLEKTDAILIQLEQLREFAESNKNYKIELEKLHSLKSESNEQRSHLVQLNQDLDNKLMASKLEMNLHEQANREKDGVELQRKLSALNLQLQDLQNTLRIWDRISEEYDFIEQKEQEIIQLQLQCDSTATATQQKEIEVDKLREQHEKAKYAYTLSKSNDVLKLRSDLKEGHACSVCGATHHPYHTDSELESGQLITGIRQDYEHFVVNIRTHEKELQQIRVKHTNLSARLEMGRDALSSARRRVEQHRAEWAITQSIDHQIKDTSRTINREARKLLLLQLIERATKNSEEAKAELEKFKFHQANIARITNEMNGYNENKHENIILLSNVNHAIKMYTSKIEEMQTAYEKSTGRYNELFQALNRVMTIPTWFKEWATDYEAFKNRLQKMQLDKTSRILKTTQNKSTEIRNSTLMELLRQTITRREKKQQELRKRIEQINRQIEQSQTMISTTTGEENYVELLKKIFVVAKETEQTEKQTLKEFEETQKRLLILENDETKCRALIKEQEMRLQELHAQLDLWLHKFNADNPPAQWTELQRLFEDKRDWNVLRKQLHELQNRVLIAQHEVDKARSALSTHQAKVMRPEDKGEESRESLLFRQEELENELHEVIIKHASILAQIRTYEQYNRNDPSYD